MISLMDTWIMDPDRLSPIKWVCWMPVDGDPLPKPIKDVIGHAFDRITMSQYGERVLKEAGFDSTYIPHGFDPAIYRVQDKGECRTKLGFPKDTFIASMVAANKCIPSRKAFPQHFEAFKALCDKHDDVFLYVHTNVEGIGGYRLAELAERIGIPGDKIAFVSQYHYSIGFPDEYVAAVYAASDVLLHVSTGEGFGLTGLEANACGTPTITGDWTAMPEVQRGGWLLDKSDAERYATEIGDWQYHPHAGAIAERLEAAYLRERPEIYPPLAGSVFTPQELHDAVAADYAVDVVMERHWTPYFANLERRLEEIARLHSAVQVKQPATNGVSPRDANRAALATMAGLRRA
jgi:glycosyltransferase involved in cell wall biosynthesis